MTYSIEKLYHFSCQTCRNWWSIASTDEWKPKSLYCPHCSQVHKYDVMGNLTNPEDPNEQMGKIIYGAGLGGNQQYDTEEF